MDTVVLKCWTRQLYNTLERGSQDTFLDRIDVVLDHQVLFIQNNQVGIDTGYLVSVYRSTKL